jgi:hypothetical protein
MSGKDIRFARLDFTHYTLTPSRPVGAILCSSYVLGPGRQAQPICDDVKAIFVLHVSAFEIALLPYLMTWALRLVV